MATRGRRRGDDLRPPGAAGERARARGLGYRRVATVEIGDVELPSAAGITVGLTNRHAILARGGRGPANVQTGASPARCRSDPQGSFGLGRGWAAVDAGTADRTLRFITTHLEVGSPAAGAQVQLAQVDELLDGPAGPRSRSSWPATSTRARPPGVRRASRGRLRRRLDAHQPGRRPGFTCCHARVARQPGGRLRTRIDLIFTRGDIGRPSAFVVGDRPGDFRGGLWPSDHAGVVARLAVPYIPHHPWPHTLPSVTPCGSPSCRLLVEPSRRGDPPRRRPHGRAHRGRARARVLAPFDGDPRAAPTGCLARRDGGAAVQRRGLAARAHAVRGLDPAARAAGGRLRRRPRPRARRAPRWAGCRSRSRRAARRDLPHLLANVAAARGRRAVGLASQHQPAAGADRRLRGRRVDRPSLLRRRLPDHPQRRRRSRPAACPRRAARRRASRCESPSSARPSSARACRCCCAPSRRCASRSPPRLSVIGVDAATLAPLLADPRGVRALGRVGDAEKRAALARADVLCAPSLGRRVLRHGAHRGLRGRHARRRLRHRGYRGVVERRPRRRAGPAAATRARSPRRCATSRSTRRGCERLGRARPAARPSAMPGRASPTEVLERLRGRDRVPAPGDLPARAAVRIGLRPADLGPRRPARRLPSLEPAARRRARAPARVARRTALVPRRRRRGGRSLRRPRSASAGRRRRAVLLQPRLGAARASRSCRLDGASRRVLARDPAAALPAARPRFTDALQGTPIGVLMSATLPARLGEPSRALIVARRLGRPRELLPPVLGTLVVPDAAEPRRAGHPRRGDVRHRRPVRRPPAGAACSTRSRRSRCCARCSSRPGCCARAAVALAARAALAGAARAALRACAPVSPSSAARGSARPRPTQQLAAWALQWLACFVLLVALGLDDQAPAWARRPPCCSPST